MFFSAYYSICSFLYLQPEEIILIVNIFLDVASGRVQLWAIATLIIYHTNLNG